MSIADDLAYNVPLNPGHLTPYIHKGGEETLRTYLKESGAWDGTSLAVAPVHRLHTDGTIASTSWLLQGKIKPTSWLADSMWGAAAPKTLRVTIDLPDTTIFNFIPNQCVSSWIPSGELGPVYEQYDHSNAWIPCTPQDAEAMGATEFIVRAQILPIGLNEAAVSFVALPFSYPSLVNRVTHPKSTLPTIPIFHLHTNNLAQGPGTTLSIRHKAASAYLIPKQPVAGLGFGTMALIDSLAVVGPPGEALPLPSPTTIRHNTRAFLASAVGPNGTDIVNLEKKLTDHHHGIKTYTPARSIYPPPPLQLPQHNQSKPQTTPHYPTNTPPPPPHHPTPPT